MAGPARRPHDDDQGARLKIYTRTGDDGTTGLLGPGRVGKDDLRIEAYGTVDELNAALGVVRASGLDTASDDHLAAVQSDLFTLGAALADPDPTGRFQSHVDAEVVGRVESWIDAMEAKLPPLANFILPGGTPQAAQAHLARTVCRRAERAVVRLSHGPGEHVNPHVIAYLNRLGDALFVFARHLNRLGGVGDHPWEGL